MNFNMDNFDTLEKLIYYLKQANCYGKYNYCFTAQKKENVNLALMGIFGGAIGGAIAHKLNDEKVIGYILNKNEKGIAILPIIGDIKNPIVDIENLLFKKNEDIEKVVIKKDGFSFKIIKIVLNDKEEFSFRMANKIKNCDYHEVNLNKFIEMYK